MTATPQCRCLWCGAAFHAPTDPLAVAQACRKPDCVRRQRGYEAGLARKAKEAHRRKVGEEIVQSELLT